MYRNIPPVTRVFSQISTEIYTELRSPLTSDPYASYCQP